MAEKEVHTLHGEKTVLFFRLVKERATKKAMQLAFETTHEITSKRDGDETATKTGTIRSSGTPSESISFEFIASNADVAHMLEYAYRKGLEVEFWRIDLENPKEDNDPKASEGKFWAYTGKGLLNQFSLPADVSKGATISTELGIQGKIANIWATVSKDDQKLAQLYYDTVKGNKPVDTVEIYTPEAPTPIKEKEARIDAGQVDKNTAG